MDTTITHSLLAYSTREGPPSKSSALRCVPLHVLQSRNSIRGSPVHRDRTECADNDTHDECEVPQFAAFSSPSSIGVGVRSVPEFNELPCSFAEYRRTRHQGIPGSPVAALERVISRQNLCGEGGYRGRACVVPSPPVAVWALITARSRSAVNLVRGVVDQASNEAVLGLEVEVDIAAGHAARGEIADADSASSVDHICRGSEDRATSTNGLLLLVDRLRSVHLCGARTQIRQMWFSYRWAEKGCG